MLITDFVSKKKSSYHEAVQVSLLMTEAYTMGARTFRIGKSGQLYKSRGEEEGMQIQAGVSVLSTHAEERTSRRTTCSFPSRCSETIGVRRWAGREISLVVHRVNQIRVARKRLRLHDGVMVELFLLKRRSNLGKHALVIQAVSCCTQNPEWRKQRSTSALSFDPRNKTKMERMRNRCSV